jgi:xanthine/uracil permease
MTGGILFFLIVGIVFALVGFTMLVAALRGAKSHDGTASRAERRSTALLIAGMMTLAFGLVMSGFAIAYTTTKPYDANDVGQ